MGVGDDMHELCLSVCLGRGIPPSFPSWDEKYVRYEGTEVGKGQELHVPCASGESGILRVERGKELV